MLSSKNDTINDRMASYRSLAGYTQEEAAEALGMNKNSYARMERSGSPKSETLIKMATLFNVPVEHILYGEKPIVKADTPKTDTVSFHDVGFEPEGSSDVKLTTNEKNCIKLCRNLTAQDRNELFDYINKYIEEHLK